MLALSQLHMSFYFLIREQQGHHHNGEIRPLDDRTYSVRSAFTHLALMKAVGLFKASLQSQKMSHQTCSVDIFVDLQPFGCNLIGRLVEPEFRGGELAPH